MYKGGSTVNGDNMILKGDVEEDLPNSPRISFDMFQKLSS